MNQAKRTRTKKERRREGTLIPDSSSLNFPQNER